ncbi:MAG: hypothetical protein ACI84R_001226 [Candidatus Azotimanducaceae bacterium]|jgi:hypothetical protein
MEICHVTRQTTHRWLTKHPIPSHSPSTTVFRRRFLLEDIVILIRTVSRGGMTGHMATRLTDHDAAARAAAGDEAMYLGTNLQERADALIAVLTPDELDRLRSARSAFTKGALAGKCGRIATVRHALILYPPVLSYVLAYTTRRMPVGKLGWYSTARALTIINVESTPEQEEV